jgi:hypothetical protein
LNYDSINNEQIQAVLLDWLLNCEKLRTSLVAIPV